MPHLRLLPGLLAFAAVAILPACKDDEPFDTPATPTVEELHLDGPNATGPILDAGTHRFGVRFTEADLAAYAGQELTGFRVFVGAAPASLRLSVSAGGELVPGDELVVLNVNGFPNVRQFVDYTLARPVEITGDEPLWLVAEVELSDGGQSLGCDAGPTEQGGDWLWSGDRWLTYRERTGERINWNLRGLVR